MTPVARVFNPCFFPAACGFAKKKRPQIGGFSNLILFLAKPQAAMLQPKTRAHSGGPKISRPTIALAIDAISTHPAAKSLAVFASG